MQADAHTETQSKLETTPANSLEQGRANVQALVPAAAPPTPAAIVLSVPPAPKRRRWPMRMALLILLLVAASGGGAVWWREMMTALPLGIATGNGRLEADEVDIDTKFAGRILTLHADEGDMVKAGQVVAVMDTRDLQAQLKQYQQIVLQARQTLDQARANYAQQQAVVTFAQQQVARSTYLVPKGFATVETLDQQKQQLDSATANLSANEAAIGAAQHALDAATHQVEFYAINITDNSLVAPKTGPIEYRVANTGEVLPAGGKVFTMLDASYVYMDVYLPTEQAGRIQIGAEARIVLDAYPAHVIPAKVVFISRQAQFTPKTVETRSERDKLMFRVRVRINPDRLEGREAIVRSGLPGAAFLRTDTSIAWPANLAPSPAPAVEDVSPAGAQ